MTSSAIASVSSSFPNIFTAAPGAQVTDFVREALKHEQCAPASTLCFNDRTAQVFGRTIEELVTILLGPVSVVEIVDARSEEVRQLHEDLARQKERIDALIKLAKSYEQRANDSKKELRAIESVLIGYGDLIHTTPADSLPARLERSLADTRAFVKRLQEFQGGTGPVYPTSPSERQEAAFKAMKTRRDMARAELKKLRAGLAEVVEYGEKLEADALAAAQRVPPTSFSMDATGEDRKVVIRVGDIEMVLPPDARILSIRRVP